MANATPAIHYSPKPQPEDLASLTGIIHASNVAVGWPDAKHEEFGFFLRDQGGATVGGISGYLLYDWLFVQFLAVPEHLRGQGIGRALPIKSLSRRISLSAWTTGRSSSH